MKYRFLPGLVALFSMLFVSTHAQAGIVGAPLSTLPVNSPVMLVALVLALAALAWWGMRRAGVRSLHSIMLPLLLVSSGVWLASSPELRAQVMVAFTNPHGQTLNLPYNPDAGDTEFEVTNSSGVRLRIAEIIYPDECLIIVLPPEGGPELLKPDVMSAQKTQAPSYCHVGDVLGNNQSCIVDFGFCAWEIGPLPQ